MENIIYRNNEGIEYIQFKRLLEYPEVTHCYTMRSNNQLNFQIKNIDFFRQSCDRILKSLNLIVKMMSSWKNSMLRKPM